MWSIGAQMNTQEKSTTNIGLLVTDNNIEDVHKMQNIEANICNDHSVYIATHIQRCSSAH